MKIRHLFLVLSLAAFFGCQKDFDETSSLPEESVGNAIQGEIRMKLDRETADALNVTRTRSGGVQTGNLTLDELCKRYRVTGMERVFDDNGCAERTRKAGLDLWYTVRFEGDAAKISEDFGHTPGVTHVEAPLRIKQISPIVPVVWSPSRSVMALPHTLPDSYPFDDPLADKQWPLYNDGTINRYAMGGSDINILPAWEKSTGRSDVIVAVVDEGVQYNHPDLAANMWEGIGRNFTRNADQQSDITWGRGHGTHVAGTIAAVNNNGIGMSGIAGGTGSGDGVRIMTCEIFHPHSALLDATSSQTANALKYAADNGAVIAQCSWGYDAGTYTEEAWMRVDRALKEAIDYFIEYAGMSADGTVQTGPMAGGAVIFAAGNEGSSRPGYPAAYKPCLSVAAISCNYQAAWYSNYGSTIDINAPGGGGWLSYSNIAFDQGYNLSTLPTDLHNGDSFTYTDSYGQHTETINYVSDTPGYGYMQGTSMACPHVSGVAALIVSHFGGAGFTNDRLREMLLSHTRDVDGYQSGVPSRAGKIGKLIDAGAALYSGSEYPFRRPTIAPAEGQEGSIKLQNDDVRTLTFALSDYTSWELKDLSGNIVAEQSGDEIALTIDASKYAAGSYWTILQAAGGTQWASVYIAYSIAKSGPEITPAPGQEDSFTLMTGETVALEYKLSRYDTWVLEDPSGHIETSFADDRVTLRIRSAAYAPGTYSAELRATKDAYTASRHISYEIVPLDADFYPNPCDEWLNVECRAAGDATLHMRNAVGFEAMNRSVTFASDGQPVRLDVSGLTAGVYLVDLEYNGVRISRTVIKR